MAQLPHFSVSITSAPSAEPISVATAKSWLRVSPQETTDDAMIQSLISTARSLIETWTWRPSLLTTYKVAFDRFPLIPNSQYSPGNPNLLTPVLQNTWPLDPSAWAIILPRAPVVTGSVSITYQQTQGGAFVTLDPTTYQVDNISEPARIVPVSGSYWPGVIYQANSILVSFQAGYAGATDNNSVPPEMITAMRMLIARMYGDPESVDAFRNPAAPTAFEALLDSVRVQYIF